MLSALIDQAPGSLTSRAPLCSAGSQRQNTAPAGSAQTATRAAARRSKGSVTTLPPASVTFSAAASALSTQTWVPHAATGGRPPPRSEPIAATGRPRSVHTKYLPGEPDGIVSSASQPNSVV